MRQFQNSFCQLLEIKLDKSHMTESLVGSGAPFHKAVNPPVVVEPVETPFHLPALTGIPGLSTFRESDCCSVVLPSGNARVYISGSECATQEHAVISLVRPETHGCSHDDAVNRT